MSVKPLKRKHFQIENGLSKQRTPIIPIEAYNEAKKVNLFTQSNREATKKANLLKCQHQGKKKKKKKKKSVPHNQIRKGKRVVKQIDVDQQATGIHFQEQIVVEILSRLPLRSVVRFKCVSKIWESLISDPYFKMKKHQSPDSNSQKLLIRKLCSTQGGLSKFNFYSSSLSTFEDVQQLDSPLTYNVDHYDIFSSFDGLVLLGVDTQLLLWNPFTRESALLPHSEFNVRYTSFGLGYDAAGDGYKVLKLNMRLQQSMEILTLKRGLWRKICNYPTAVCPTTGYEMEIVPRPSKIVPMEPLVYVHGAFHWLGDLKVTGNYYVVSFSISNEVYGDVPLLEEMGKKVSYRPDFGLSLLDGMLCFHTTTNDGSLGSFKLWAMKDYGVKESWIVLFTIQLNGLFIAKPRYRFPDGELLLYAPGEFPYQCGLKSAYAIAKLRKAGYSKQKFYTEAVSIYKEINTQMADGGKATLRKLVTEHMYSALKNEIKQRESVWPTVYWELIEPIVKVRTLRARLIGVDRDDLSKVFIQLTLEFLSKQKFEAYDGKGAVVSGDKNKEVLVRDIWVFEKSLFHPGAYWRLCGRIKV